MPAEQLDLFGVRSSTTGEAVTDAQDALPRVAREIRDLVGEEALIRLVLKFGGTHLDMPANPALIERSRVVERVADEIGWGAAKQLAEHYRGHRLHMPLCKQAVLKIRRRAIRQALDAGNPAAVIARRYGITERAVWYAAKEPD